MNSISPRRMPISSNSRSDSRDNSRTASRYLRQAVNFSEIVLRAVMIYSFSGRHCVYCSAVCSACSATYPRPTGSGSVLKLVRLLSWFRCPHTLVLPRENSKQLAVLLGTADYNLLSPFFAAQPDPDVSWLTGI